METPLRQRNGIGLVGPNDRTLAATECSDSSCLQDLQQSRAMSSAVWNAPHNLVTWAH